MEHTKRMPNPALVEPPAAIKRCRGCKQKLPLADFAHAHAVLCLACKDQLIERAARAMQSIPSGEVDAPSRALPWKLRERIYQRENARAHRAARDALSEQPRSPPKKPASIRKCRHCKKHKSVEAFDGSARICLICEDRERQLPEPAPVKRITLRDPSTRGGK